MGNNGNLRGDRPCPQCDGTGWVVYLSETVGSGSEEAYRLCPEGHAPRYCIGSRIGGLCPRPATVRRGEIYSCEEHAAYRPR